MVPVTIVPEPGAPPIVNNSITLYKTRAVKKLTHLPYMALWSSGSEGYHFMRMWITSEDGPNGPGGSWLFSNLLLAPVGAVPPSVTGEWVLTHNTYNENHDKINEGESWDWASSTIPNHRVGPGGAEWSYTFSCPYDSLLVPTGRFTLHHAYGSETLDVSLVIRDWVLRGSEGARYMLIPDEDGNAKVRLKLFGNTVPDNFAVTGIKYQLQIRKDGAGTGDSGVVYRKDDVAPDQVGTFMLVHEWDGKANRKCRLDTGWVQPDDMVPYGRYVVEWAFVSCCEGLEAPLCLNPVTHKWGLDKNNPINGGIITVGDIALSELIIPTPIPDQKVCEANTLLSALPLGTSVVQEHVQAWVDINEAALGFPAGTLPGKGCIAKNSHVIPASTPMPHQLRYSWPGGARVYCEGEQPSTTSELAPYGAYTVRVTAKLKSGRGYHNAVQKDVWMLPSVHAEPLNVISPTDVDLYDSDDGALEVRSRIHFGPIEKDSVKFQGGITFVRYMRIFHANDYATCGLAGKPVWTQSEQSAPTQDTLVSVKWDGAAEAGAPVYGGSYLSHPHLGNPLQQAIL